MEINVEAWKEFKVGDIFSCKTCPSSIKIELNEGDIPYISRTAVNNGQDGFVDVEEQMITKGNCITIGAEGVYAFYQANDFATGVKIYCLRNKHLNREIGLFLCTILNMENFKYNYGRARVLAKIKNETIKLPVDELGKPDWGYMERFTRKFEESENSSGHTIRSCIKTGNKYDGSRTSLDHEDWEEFYLYKIFNATMGNGIDSIATTIDNPKYNYVSRDSNGNGVVGFVDKVENQEPFPAGAMSLALGGSYLGTCFIQKEPFYTAQNVGVLQEKEPLSIHTKLFIATLIRNECKVKYQAFGRELNSHFRKDFTIKLPVLKKDNKVVIDQTKKYSDEGYIPDWEWMENYMKSLPYGDRVDF
jgi:hypothetical protein